MKPIAQFVLPYCRLMALSEFRLMLFFLDFRTPWWLYRARDIYDFV